MPKQPKTLADYIMSMKARLNKAAFQAGTYLYSLNTPKKKESPVAKLPPKKVPETSKSSPPLSEVIPTAHSSSDDKFTRGLIRFERELATLRQAYKDAQDDIDRNALHFRILRLERARKKFLDEYEAGR